MRAPSYHAQEAKQSETGNPLVHRSYVDRRRANVQNI
jgi:hypothetical protein